MIEKLIEVDSAVFLILNGLGSPYLDGFMQFMSNRYVWIPLYFLLIFRLYVQYGYRIYQPLILIAIIILLTDQTTSSIMKPFFERLRPCKDPELQGWTMVIGKCTGAYGFASGHAANSFGVAGFFYTLEKSRLGISLLIWASVVSYSRIYLGVHFPGDVIVGALIGLSYSFLIIKLSTYTSMQIKAY